MTKQRRRWRGGLAEVALIVAGLALGLLIPTVDRGPTVPARPLSDMLIAVGLASLGSVTIVISMLFLVVQWVATTFTPRLTLFRDNPIVWRTFGVAIGQAVYSLTAALAIGTRSEASVAVPSVSILLLLVTFAMLRLLLLRAFAAIQLAPVLSSIADRGRAALETEYRQTAGPRENTIPEPPDTAAAPSLPEDRYTVVWPHPPLVLHRIRTGELMRAATETGSVVVLYPVPGKTLQRGAAVAEVHGPPIAPGRVIDSLVVGSERRFDHDVLLAPRVLADIALRALSPAINDPATAVQALDELEDLLGRVAAGDTEPRHLVDDAGRLRVVLPRPQLEDFLRSAIDDVVAAAAGSPMVLDRLHGLLTRIRAGVPDRHRRLLDVRLAWTARLAARFPQV